jgi:hypothetical protein
VDQAAAVVRPALGSVGAEAGDALAADVAVVAVAHGGDDLPGEFPLDAPALGRPTARAVRGRYREDGAVRFAADRVVVRRHDDRAVAEADERVEAGDARAEAPALVPVGRQPVEHVIVGPGADADPDERAQRSVADAEVGRRSPVAVLIAGGDGRLERSRRLSGGRVEIDHVGADSDCEDAVDERRVGDEVVAERALLRERAPVDLDAGPGLRRAGGLVLGRWRRIRSVRPVRSVHPVAGSCGARASALRADTAGGSDPEERAAADTERVASGGHRSGGPGIDTWVLWGGRRPPGPRRKRTRRAAPLRRAHRAPFCGLRPRVRT